MAVERSTSENISRNYLHDEVAQRLRALIQSGMLKPDERLNESALAARFGISRTPLREAIKVLSSEGLLDLLPNRGARVARISRQEIEEMTEVIAGLEATAGDLAAQCASEAEIEAIAALHAEMVSAHDRGDAPAYFTLNRRIHEAIMDAAHNTTLQSMYRQLSSRIQEARYMAHQTAEQWQTALEDHQEMVALLRARDSDALGRLMRRHIRSKKPVIAATFGED